MNDDKLRPEEWANVRAMWESGNYNISRELYYAVKKKYGNRCPSFATLSNKIYGEGWKRTKPQNATNISDKKKDIEEIFRDLGHPLERRIEELIEIISSPDDIQEQIIDIMREMADKAADDRERDRLQVKLRDMFNSRTKALGTKLQALSESFKLTGVYAPERKTLTLGGNLDNLSTDELENELKRLEKTLDEQGHNENCNDKT